MRSFRRLLLVVIAVLPLAACQGDRGTGATREVRFEALETYPGGAATPPGRVDALLTVPPGEGPFPAVVMLHGCAGLYETHEEWAELFARWGYASLRIDSFGSRGIEEICTDIMRPVPRAADVNGAIVFLRTVPGIDADRLVVMGWSHGAGVALQAAVEPGSLRDDLKPAVLGTIAVYPWCTRSSQPFRVPVEVLIGDADDWTPAGLCESMAEDLPPGSAPVELTVYPGATHSYDCKACDGEYWGHRLVFDRAAYEDSVARVRAFLAAILAPSRDVPQE